MALLKLFNTVEKIKLEFYMPRQALRWQIMGREEINLLILGVRQQMLILLIDMDNGLILTMLLFTFIMFMEVEKLDKDSMPL